MKSTEIFDKLWETYVRENPSAKQIHDLFSGAGNRVVNDHVAFRTFDDPRVGIEVLAKPFLEAGYEPKEDYLFRAKKLRARHYEMPGVEEAPRVFISELMLSEFSKSLRDTVGMELDQLPEGLLQSEDLIFKGSVFQALSHERYLHLRRESEYAAWVYVFGFRANHFTVSINYLDSLGSIQEVNAFLKAQGFPLNSSGGEVKGTPDLLLEQSSTLADQVEVSFGEGKFRVPACYYEFARRYRDDKGQIFSGFIADSADKIFESTDYR